MFMINSNHIFYSSFPVRISFLLIYLTRSYLTSDNLLVLQACSIWHACIMYDQHGDAEKCLVLLLSLFL